MLAQQAAGIAIPDGSGRIVRNGVIVSAGDVMRSSADRLRNQALEMQTGAYRAPMQMLERELARVPGMTAPEQAPAFTAPASTTAQPRPMRTLSGASMPDTQVDPGELQRSLAILRDERTKIGPGVKDYSDRRLADIVRLPGGAQQIINEANAVVPVLRQSRVEDETTSYVTGLDARVQDIGREMDEITKQVGAAPQPGDAQRIAALAQVQTQYPDLGEAEQNAMAESIAAEMAQGPWKAANRDRLARLEQLRREQATASGQVQDFARRGIFPRTAPAPGSAGSSTAALAGASPLADDEAAFTQSRRELSQARIVAGDATLPGSGMPIEGRNPGGAANVTSGLSWLPPGSIAYQGRNGFVVDGVTYASEADARAALDAQRSQIAAEAGADPAALTAMLTGDVVSPAWAQQASGRFDYMDAARAAAMPAPAPVPVEVLIDPDAAPAPAPVAPAANETVGQYLRRQLSAIRRTGAPELSLPRARRLSTQEIMAQQAAARGY